MFNRSESKGNDDQILKAAMDETIKVIFEGKNVTVCDKNRVLNIQSPDGDQSQPYIEIYYAYYCRHTQNGDMIKARIFMKAIEECLRNGDRFRPEFCEFFPSCKEEFPAPSRCS